MTVFCAHYDLHNALLLLQSHAATLKKELEDLEKVICSMKQQILIPRQHLGSVNQKEKTETYNTHNNKNHAAAKPQSVLCGRNLRNLYKGHNKHCDMLRKVTPKTSSSFKTFRCHTPLCGVCQTYESGHSLTWNRCSQGSKNGSFGTHHDHYHNHNNGEKYHHHNYNNGEKEMDKNDCQLCKAVTNTYHKRKTSICNSSRSFHNLDSFLKDLASTLKTMKPCVLDNVRNSFKKVLDEAETKEHVFQAVNAKSWSHHQSSGEMKQKARARSASPSVTVNVQYKRVKNGETVKDSQTFADMPYKHPSVTSKQTQKECIISRANFLPHVPLPTSSKATSSSKELKKKDDSSTLERRHVARPIQSSVDTKASSRKVLFS